MALQKQIIEVPLGAGVQTKADPKVVQPGSMLVVENGEFDELGAVSKRNGYTALTQSTLSGGSISAGAVLAKYGDELVMLDGSTLYTYSSEASKWVSRGTCAMAGMKTRRVPASAAAQMADASTDFTAGMAAAGGYTAVIWSTSSGGVYATVYGTTTGAVIVACTQLATAADRVRVSAVASGAKIFLLYVTGANMKMQYFDTSAPGSGLTSATNLVTDVDSGSAFEQCFDAKDFDGAGTCVVAYRNTGNNLAVAKFTTAGVTASTTAAVDPYIHIGVVVSAASDIYIGYRDRVSSDFYCLALTSALASKFGATLVEALDNCSRIFGIEQSTNSILWVYGNLASTTVFQIRKATVSSAGAVSGAALVVRGANPASGLFSSGGVIYLVAQSNGSSNELGTNAAWLINTSGEVCGSALAGFAAKGSPYSTQSTICSLGSGVYATVIPAQFDTDNPYLPVEVRIEMGRRCEPVEFAQSLCIPGAQLWQYDGTNVVEHGFPVIPVASSAQGASGSLADGSYQICVVYEWYDATGRRHQSAPSTAVTQTVAAGGGTAKVVATAQTLRLTNKTGVKIVLYATEASGTTFYRFTSTDNDKTADTVTIDYTSSSGLNNNEILYTNGGVLENGAPPGMQSLTVRGPRLYGVTFDGTVNYTKELVDGEGAAFVTETLVRELTSDGGDEWALATLDSALVALGEGSVQIITGEGLNDTGTSDTLSQSQSVQTSLGRYGNTPVVASEDGVWFKTAAGIALLTRSLTVEPMGAPVEDYASLTTVSAVVVPNKRQIRFGHSDGSTLVYDYLAKAWAVFTNHTQVSACYWGTTYCLLTSAGAVWQQSTGFEDPSSTDITRTLETPWIKLSGLQGFQRLWYASILGEFRSAHTLTVTPYLDYGSTAETARSLALTGSSGDLLQFRFHLGKKCEAVKFKIVDSAMSGTKESCTLTSLSLEIGMKSGAYKLASGKTV
jgi:hypothetical protein